MQNFVELKHYGPCTKSEDKEGNLQSNCSKTYKPVCGRDAVTYRNKCSLLENNVALSSEGPCFSPFYKELDPPLKCNC